jgi:alpha-glucosidase (family GH31 glycosyl hydrolase)
MNLHSHWLFAMLLLPGFLQASELLSFKRTGNRVVLAISDGAGELEWISSSSFRYRRSWRELLPNRLRVPEEVDLDIRDSESSLEISSTYLVVTIQKRGLQLRANTHEGETLFSDAAEARRSDGTIVLTRTASPSARFFGLGMRDGPVELRGHQVQTDNPFLLSTAGYGERHTAQANYLFDFGTAQANQYRVEIRGSDEISYFLYYGPGIKEILEQHLIVSGPLPAMRTRDFQPLAGKEIPPYAQSAIERPSSSFEALRRAVRVLINGCLSGVLLPSLDLGKYREAPVDLYQRATQLGIASPFVLLPEPWPGDLARTAAYAALEHKRKAAGPYLETYAQEARDRGLPMVHPLPLQFPRDPNTYTIEDQFMLGDELLVAPILSGSGKRAVYLPMGAWTRLSTNQQFHGRQTIQIEAEEDELPIFSRNGAIFPVIGGWWDFIGPYPMELHYFPKLAGEFFLWESDLSAITQVHAAPAGDVMRLEIESKKDRDYEWVIHHAGKVTRVAEGDRNFQQGWPGGPWQTRTWFFEEGRGNLHVRIHAKEDSDVIVNVYFEETPTSQ